MTTRPVESRRRVGAKKERSGSPESPRYAEVGRGRIAIRKEIKTRRGRRDLMNAARTSSGVGRGAPRVWCIILSKGLPGNYVPRVSHRFH